MDPFASAAAGGAPPPEEDYSKLSIEDRLASKAWKARVSAYEELVRAFEKTPDETDSIFKPFTHNTDTVRAMVTDSNAVAQEKALDAVKAFLHFGGKAAGQTRETVMPAVVEKCFGAARMGTKKAALEIVELFAEAEDVVGCEGIVNDVLRGTTAKQPKVVACATTALANLVRDFGPKQVNFKQILKKTPDIFGHADKGVRQEAAILAQELHKWIGSALEPTLGALKEIQARELREQFAKLDEEGGKSVTPVRYLASQMPRVPQAASADSPNAAQADPEEPKAAEEAVDPYDFIEPVDPLRSKLWPSNFDEMMASSKWLERKEVLEQCMKALDTAPKMIYTAGVDSVVDVLAEKIRKDANINVCLAACQCIIKFANGLRGDFSRNKDKVLPPLLEKLKERKESTVKVLAETLDAVFQTVTLSDILEQTLGALKHKNPAVKTGTIQFLARCLRETRIMPAKGDIKPIADALVAAMSDGAGDVRDAGAQGLGTLMKLIGERPMNQYLGSLDDIKKAKVQEQYNVATVKVKQNGASVQRAGPPPSVPPSAPLPRIQASTSKSKPSFAPPPVPEKENKPPSASDESKASPARGPPARLLARQAPGPRPSAIVPSRPSAPIASAKKGRSPAPAAAATEPVKFRFSQEDAETRASELVPQPIVDDLSNSVWKERLAGMGRLNEWLKVEVETAEAELIARFLAKRPGWKESNFQVMAEVYVALRTLAQDCPTFGRPTVALSVAPLCEKLGDIKLKTPAGETLTLFAEKTSFGFLLNQALGPLASLKAPKAIADSLLWVNQALLDFGTAGVDVRGIVNHLLTCLKSANAGVRTNATTTIGTLARFIGPALSSFLGDLNPQLRATVEGAIESATQEPAPAPSRFSDELMAKSGANGAEGAAEGQADKPGTDAVDEDALDALIPRVDLDKIVPSSIISKLGDANWKERKEGAEELLAILEANSRLKPSLSDVGNALKARYTDSNMQVKSMCLDALAKIASGMNKGFEPHTRTFVAPVTQVLSDSKAPMRAAAAKTLAAIAEQVGVAVMIPGFVTVLDSKAANPMLRQDLLTWLAEWFEAHSPEKGMELNGLALPTIMCLDDKLAAVRKAAQSVLPFIIMRAGYKFVMEQTGSLKTASRSTVVPLIDAARAQAASKAPAPAKPQAPSAMAAARLPGATRQPQGSKPGIGAAASSMDGESVGTGAVPRTAKPVTAVGRPLKPLESGRVDMNATQGNRPTMRKPISNATNAAPMTTRAVGGDDKGSSQSNVAPFLTSEGKGKALRERREAARHTMYWIGSEATARPELVEVLYQQCETYIGAPLLEKMFSKDHSAERDYLSALTLLSDYTSNTQAAAEEYGLAEAEAAGRAIANSDLVFKYIAIRLTESNTSIALKCLDVLANLIALLRSQEYHMSEYEANAILPCIIAKFGDPKIAVRDQIRSEIMRKLTYVYPPSKVFGRLLEEGLNSKNVRVRVECLGEIAFLFQKYGIQVCALPKALPVVAKQISDRDNGVRSAALLAIGEVYKVIGNDVWQHVGKLPPKEVSLLEERLKRTAAPAFLASATGQTNTSKPTAATVATVKSQSLRLPSSPVRMSRPGPPPATALPAAPATVGRAISGKVGGPAAQSRLAVPSRIARPGQTGIPGPSAAPRTSRAPGESEIGRPSQRSAQLVQRQSMLPRTSPTKANGHVRPHSSASRRAPSAASVESSARRFTAILPPQASPEEDLQIEAAITEILSSESDTSVAALKKIERDIQAVTPALAKHADSLVIAFGKQLQRAFARGSDLNNERLKKHLLITGTSIFDNTRMWEDASGIQRTLGAFMNKSAVVSILTELLQQLIETKGATDEETQTHGRYLNIIVLRSFSSCGLNVLFGGCLSMLAEATEDLEDIRARNDAIFEKRIRFADLICKCLWKNTRKLNASLTDELVDPVELLRDLESFLQAIPPSIWKQRASEEMPLGDTPLRTVKVIITHIGSVYGENSLELLEHFADPEHTFVYAHLLKVCDRGEGVLSAEAAEEELARKATTVDAPESPVRRAHSQRVAGTASGPVARDGPRQSVDNDEVDADELTSASAGVADPNDGANAELRSIFDRIASKSESRAAIKDLYLFQRRYPHNEASIQRSLQQTGPIFQKFIRRALANHAAEDGEPLPMLESDETHVGRESVYSSPGGMSAARSSMMIDWQSSAAALQRGSNLNPASPSRTPHRSSAGQTWGTPPSNGVGKHRGDMPVHARSHDDAIGMSSSSSLERFGDAEDSLQRRARESSGVNEDRLAQLRAKFARPASEMASE